MKIYYVYILKCSDNSYYTGVTSNLQERLIEHKNGKHKNSYTFKRRPLNLVFYSEFTNIELAIEKEKQLKKWSKVKKEALINDKFEKLPNLAKKKFK
ncbi:GIY-YIG nuclease family protein [Tenacibaculum finnmarkense genomovar finnmarkense]|uniref:GIY-YIG nuclease family protein n=1 Tax=Tenacibaculum TaxID=104267 RepID=UPI001E643E7F|nr:GIY-YIG nuclease family protein [Tenacibaculum finnmarkense]MCD8416648.1 GIY-YIG nuclease family protein [Tenacibaculum finnmarkense genomovar finnmarkense]MCG8184630.1 GIY-YIG nuclease family protein [Tenacibaculum finnmarkense genomovar finnmarkense]MCG8201754.1 GIY-YIG nuclease family protein [Tenacibaculum finnmarkense genomovar finnmarkense]MCG8208664.1 GIY-YIG nuclease family protein [Tenacibaculum finnmarkense genomovar finnmarkense]MCG8211395.1 GIY-YIG nuclease family protein [Tenac